MKKFFPYIIIGILLAVLFFKACGNDKKGTPNNTTRIDTVYVKDTIPGESIKVEQTDFEPEIIHKDNPELLEKIRQLKSEKERLEFLLSKLKTKVYDTTYTFSRGEFSGQLKIMDSVQGSLLGRKWDLTIDPVVFEKPIITKTKTKYPKFSFSAGLSTGLTTDFSTQFREPYIGLQIGFRNRNGYTLQLGYNSLQQAEITLSKDFWTVY